MFKSPVKIMRSLLMEPEIANIDVNSPDLIIQHRRILKRKKIIQQVFNEFYNHCIKMRDQFLLCSGLEIELGAGSSFFKEQYAHIITTDLKPAQGLDRTIDAQSMQIDSNSVRAFYMLNAFHHLPRPDQFFLELTRTLKPGGGAILIEPYYGPVAQILFKHLFSTETFDKSQSDWSRTEQAKAMSGANQALSYIVFVRDKRTWEAKYPELEIIQTSIFSNHLRYLLSGGINFKQLMPDFLLPFIYILEWLLGPIRPLVALHYSIVIRKKIT